MERIGRITQSVEVTRFVTCKMSYDTRSNNNKNRNSLKLNHDWWDWNLSTGVARKFIEKPEHKSSKDQSQEREPQITLTPVVVAVENDFYCLRRRPRIFMLGVRKLIERQAGRGTIGEALSRDWLEGKLSQTTLKWQTRSYAQIQKQNGLEDARSKWISANLIRWYCAQKHSQKWILRR